MIKTCIIAEHDPWDIQLLRVYVEKIGFRVVLVCESQEVLPLAQREQPDMILLESELPGILSSQQVLERLKQDHSIGRVPVVLFSWSARPVACEMVPGAEGYLQKPATYEAFLASLAEAGVS